MDTEQPTIEQLWKDTDDVFENQFIENATEKGVARYEKILGINPKSNYTLYERKFNILAKLNESSICSMEQLNNSLTSLCGADGYSLRLNPNNYTLDVKLASSNENNLEAVDNYLYRMLPANILYTLGMFNTNAMISVKTHQELAAYTHKQLREDII